MINVNKYQVLVDWDGDGQFKPKLLKTTPKNLVPAAQSQGGTGFRQMTPEDKMLDSTVLYVDTPHVDDNGITYRTLKHALNSGAFTDAAPHSEGGMLEWLPGQTRPGDNGNLFNTAPMNMLKAAGFNKLLRLDVYKDLEIPDYVGVNTIRLRGKPFSAVLGTAQLNLTLGSTTAMWVASGSFTDPAISTPTFVLTPSTPYTISFYVRVKRLLDTGKSFQTPLLTSTYRWNSNGTTNPAITLLSTSSNDIPIDGDWVHRSIQFTTPAVVTNYGFSILLSSGSADENIYDFEVAGIQVVSGNQSAASMARFRDLSTPFRDEQFNVILEANKAYRGAFYARKNEGTYTNLVWSLYDCRIGDTAFDPFSLSNNTAIDTVNWTRIEFSIPSKAFARGLLIKLETPVNSSSSYKSVDIKGMMIWEGTEQNVIFNNGTILGYDDISSYVKKVNYKSGKASFDDALPFEGTMDLTLNNDSKIFSPNNENSPLYGWMAQSRQVQLKVKDPSTGIFETLWSGEIKTFETEPGRNSSREAVLRCEQGLFRLSESEVIVDPLQKSRIDVAVQQIVDESAWRSTSPFQCFTDAGYNTDDNAFVKDDDAFERRDQGVNILQQIGQDWDTETSPTRALQDLLESENGQMWITREGKIVFANRDYWVSAAYDPLETIVLDTQVQEASYRFGEDIINAAEVSLQPKKNTATNQILWETKRPIHVLRNAKFDVRLKFDEGNGIRPKAIIEATSEDLEVQVYLADPVKFPDTPEAEERIRNLVKCELLRDGRGFYTFRITNKSGKKAWVTASVKGSSQETGDEMTATAQNLEAIEAAQAIRRQSLRSPILDKQEQAAATASALIIRNAFSDGEFSSIVLNIEDNTFVQKALDYQQGVTLLISETQTDEANRLHTILGVEGYIDGLTFEITYNLARIDSTLYAVTGDSVTAPSTLNLIEPDCNNWLITNGGQIRSRDEAVELVFGNGGASFLLGLQERAYRYHDWNELGLFFWPSETSGGVSFLPFSFKAINTNTISNGNEHYLFSFSSGSPAQIWIMGMMQFEDKSEVAVGGGSILPPKGRPLWAVRPSKFYRAFISKSLGLSDTIHWPTYLKSSGNELSATMTNWTDGVEGASGTLSDHGDTWQNVRARTTNAAAGSVDVNAFGYAAHVSAGNDPLFNITLVNWDTLWSTHLEVGQTHYFTIWASVGLGDRTSVQYTVSIYNEAGTRLSATDITLGAAVTKNSISITSATVRCFVQIKRKDTVATTYRGDSVLVYAAAVTKGIPADDYTLLEAPSSDVALAYV